MIEKIEKFSVTLAKLDEDMLEQVRQWRNSPEVAKYMFTQNHISPKQQRAWFEKLRQDSSRAYFVIYYKNEAIGVANLSSENDIPISEAQRIYAGYYLGNNRYRGTVVAFFPALTLNDYCFNDLNCNEMAAQVIAENQAAVRFNQTLGYKISNESDGVILMTLSRVDHQQALQKFQRFNR